MYEELEKQRNNYIRRYLVRMLAPLPTANLIIYGTTVCFRMTQAFLYTQFVLR